MLRRIGGLVLVLLLGVVPCARASHTPTDTLFLLSSMSNPVIALDPATGDRHVAYLSSGILDHSWEVSGVWQTEAIADSASITSYTGFDLRVAPDGDPVAAYVRKGTFVCARREGGVWEEDTLDTGLPGPNYPIALALHPVTGEPAVAWAHSGTPSSIFYARRSAGSWTVQQVDTVSSWWLTVALGMDAAGRPHVGWGRPRADASNTMTVLTYAMGAGPDGPFVPAPVDSQLSLYLYLEMDRSNGEPRLAYSAGDYYCCGSVPHTVRYAFRIPGGAWAWTNAFSASVSVPYSGIGLALDPAGNPFIAYTLVTPIEPQDGPSAGIYSIEGCGSPVYTGGLLIYYRAGGAGLGPFTAEYLSYPQRDAGSGGRSAASGALGHVDVAWRSPRTSNCPTGIALSSTEVTGPSLVGVGDGPVSARIYATPNPLRSGEPLQVSFAIARGCNVSVVLHDIAGRRVAWRVPEAMGPGERSITWQPPRLEAGIYWLRLRGDGAPPGAQPIVVLP